MPEDDPRRYSVETQIAVLRNDVENLRRQIDHIDDKLTDAIEELRQWLRSVEAKPLNESGIRELARQVVDATSTSTTSTRDNMMRIVTFAISIGTAIFVIRGGR